MDVTTPYDELFDGLELLAPGTPEITRAMAQWTGMKAGTRVLDLGAGSGRSAVQWVVETGCRVVAIEKSPRMAARIGERAVNAGVGAWVEVVVGDMRTWEPGPADVVASEGAVYVMGFEAAARRYWSFLRPGGFFAATQLSYAVPGASEARAFWEREGAFFTIDENVAMLRGLGYDVTHVEALPREAWEAYYGPVLRRIEPVDDAVTVGMKEEARMQLDRAGWRDAPYVLYVGRALKKI